MAWSTVTLQASELVPGSLTLRLVVIFGRDDNQAGQPPVTHTRDFFLGPTDTSDTVTLKYLDYMNSLNRLDTLKAQFIPGPLSTVKPTPGPTGKDIFPT